MTYLELFILAVSLTFDTFAVSVGGGISAKDIKFSKKAMIMAFFGFFQAAYLFAGWFVGGKFANIIVEWDHWIAFVILAYLGGRMLFQAIGKREDEQEQIKDFFSFKRLFFLATATSIDAVAVGASLAMAGTDAGRIGITFIFTFLTTAAASYLGLQGGRKLGAKIGKKAEIWGGVILIFIGVRILIQHTELFVL